MKAIAEFVRLLIKMYIDEILAVLYYLNLHSKTKNKNLKKTLLKQIAEESNHALTLSKWIDWFIEHELVQDEDLTVTIDAVYTYPTKNSDLKQSSFSERMAIRNYSKSIKQLIQEIEGKLMLELGTGVGGTAANKLRKDLAEILKDELHHLEDGEKYE